MDAKKSLSNNTKRKISQSVKNAYARNKAAANAFGMNVKTYRASKKAQAITAAANPFNMFNSAAPNAATLPVNPFNMFNNKSKGRGKTNASRKWMANVKTIRNTMGVSQANALRIASQRRKNNNINALVRTMKNVTLNNKRAGPKIKADRH